MKKLPGNLSAADWKAPKAHTPEAPASNSLKASRQATRSGPKGNSSPIDPRPAPPTAAGAPITRPAGDRLRSGYLWVYASDIEFLEADQLNPSALFPAVHNHGLLLGTAL